MSIRNLSVALICFVLTMSCNKNFNPEQEKEAIINVMNQQEKDWSNGDIDSFMEGYWKSDSLTFIGRNGIANGWETTLNNYKKGYPTKNDMGKLTFKVFKLDFFNSTNAYMIGQYTLLKEETTSSGYFSLIWKKKNNKWVIVSDHTSG